ncbi:MAG: response regulator [Alphaproteobacteria bacterium]|jgi:CheY-like chemotaxis protein|nr:response regulator [Alphaproteobacteria bacterium]
MAELSLDRFSVLLAEDNPYLRTLLLQALKAMGVGTVRTVNDGGAAIEVLQLLKDDPVRAGMMNVDIILSNWQMSPVDGLMLLRWVRRHKESPCRFIPFVMVTGFADKEYVAQARELGVTEMLAKPFSVQSVAERVLQVIERPRQFVHTPNYFGPDRRRQQLASPPDGERRILTEDEIDVVYDYGT